MKKFLLIIILLFAFWTEINSQSYNANQIARIGSISISDKEFLERYEMTPGINRHRKSTIESQKIEFLFSLIAEKLWALEAISRNMDKTEVIQFTTKSFEKMFVRDALFNRKGNKRRVKAEFIKTVCTLFIFRRQSRD